MAERVLSVTIVVGADLMGRGRTYVMGTPEGNVPAEDRALIPERKWIKPITVGEVVPEIIEADSIDSLEVDQLRELAAREGVKLGNLKDPEKIRDVLREALVGV